MHHRHSAASCAGCGLTLREVVSANTAVILRSRASRRMAAVLAAHPSRLAVKNGEHLRITAVCVDYSGASFVSSRLPVTAARDNRLIASQSCSISASFLARLQPLIW